jgi:hypothetical protein
MCMACEELEQYAPPQEQLSAKGLAPARLEGSKVEASTDDPVPTSPRGEVARRVGEGTTR